MLKICQESALFKERQSGFTQISNDQNGQKHGENVFADSLVANRNKGSSRGGPNLATMFTPGVNTHLEGETQHRAQAGDYIMAAESQTKGTVPRCLTCFLIPPNKLLQINIRYSSENNSQPRCRNSWKGEKNQLAPLAACRIISSGRLGKNTHVIIRSKSFVPQFQG